MIKTLPMHMVQERNALYQKHASNWVFHEDAAFKSTNDKVNWIRERLAHAQGGKERADDLYLIQPFSSTTITVLCLHGEDKKQMDRW
jgi:hypothetical protein